MNQASTGTSRPAFGFVKILGLFIVICVIVTTITHYLWPELTGIPTVTPVSIPNHVMGDVMVALMGIAAFLHSRRMMGTEKATTFLVSSWIFAGLEETYWILSGRFGPTPTYFFTYGGLWFFEIPVYTCIAWYLICYCGYAMVKQLFPSMRSVGVAALVAAFGTCWDLWLDPAVCNRNIVSTLPNMWIWFPNGVLLFGIPILNFAGWFGVIFTVIFVFDKKLRPVEQFTPKAVGSYYMFLAVGWGVLFLALHGVGAINASSIYDLVPFVIGTAVDPAAAGTAATSGVLLLVYLALLVVGIFVIAILLGKHQVEKALKLVPAVLIGWWLNAGLGMAADILIVYPGSSLLWLMIGFSVYPVLVMIASLLKRPSSPEGLQKVAS
jgi:hypothetical protein